MAAEWKFLIAALAAFGLMALILVVPKGNEPIATPTSTTPIVASVPAFDHIYLIVMENEEKRSVVGNPNAPYLNQLIDDYGIATNYTAVAHPSQPNYVALWSGSTQGVRDDGVRRIEATNVADQLEANGKSWMVFAENVPVASARGEPICYTGATASGGPDGGGTYARKHEPAISFLDVSTDRSRCISHITNFSHFSPAAANLELIVPNLCHDMHDCGLQAGDAWLQNWLPSHLLNTSTWRNTNSALFITWDEGSTNAGGGGQVATIVVSKETPPGFTSHVPHNHYSLLRTLQAAWTLGCLKQTCEANSLGEFFSRQTATRGSPNAVTSAELSQNALESTVRPTWRSRESPH